MPILKCSFSYEFSNFPISLCVYLNRGLTRYTSEVKRSIEFSSAYPELLLYEVYKSEYDYFTPRLNV